MENQAQLRAGLRVYDAAGRYLGQIETVDQQGIGVSGQRGLVPVSEVGRIAADGVYLAGESVAVPPGVGSVAQQGSAGATETDAARTAAPALGALDVPKGQREIHVPVTEERLVVERRPTEVGDVQVRKRVEEVEERVPVSLNRDEVEVQRVPVNRPLDAPVGTRTEGEWLIVPVIEEEVVVQKRLVLREEVRIRTRRVTEQQEVREVVRRERVDMEGPTDDAGAQQTDPAWP
jgi:uncharacterized protein (TIGR02271 family)